VNIIFTSLDRIVPPINAEGFIFEVSPARNIERFVSVRISRSLFRLAVTIAEVSGFILIKPDSIEVKTLVVIEILEVVFPPLNSLRFEEIREVSVTTPHTSS